MLVIFYLFVDEVRRHVVITRVVPWSKDLLAKQEPPRTIRILDPRHLLGTRNLTSRNGIHDVCFSTAKRGLLKKASFLELNLCVSSISHVTLPVCHVTLTLALLWVRYLKVYRTFIKVAFAMCAFYQAI